MLHIAHAIDLWKNVESMLITMNNIGFWSLYEIGHPRVQQLACTEVEKIVGAARLQHTCARSNIDLGADLTSQTGKGAVEQSDLEVSVLHFAILDNTLENSGVVPIPCDSHVLCIC